MQRNDQNEQFFLKPSQPFMIGRTLKARATRSAGSTSIDLRS